MRRPRRVYQPDARYGRQGANHRHQQNQRIFRDFRGFRGSKQHHPFARIRVHWRFQKKHHPFARIRVHWRFRLTAGLTRTSGAQPITNLKSQIPLALLASWRFNLKITNLKSPDFPPPRFPFLKNAHPAIIIATNTPASRLFRRAGQIQRKGYP